MIERNSKNKQIDRIVYFGDNWEQITIGDIRYYKHKEDYYPSVTYILSAYPKGKAYESWIKSKGEEADDIAMEAALKGTQTHGAIEKILTGEEVFWVDKTGNFNYTLDEWLMILRFADFWREHKPKLIKSEFHIFSHEHKFAGTIDLILEINGEMWVVDIKTSNSLHTVYELQLAAYAKAWNEHNPDQPVKKTGILWLKSSTRGPDKSGDKIQGKNWQLKTFDRTCDESFDIFKKVYDIFLIEHKDHKPSTEIYPTSIKLSTTTEEVNME